MIRSALRSLVAGTLVLAAVLVPAIARLDGHSAQAADLSTFSPGNIISDAVFFDSLSMDAAQVQAFLLAKGSSCVAGEMPCIKDFRQDTSTQAGDAFCSAYQGAAQESAAAIIAKVGVACGINPRVLVVLLQKEQGLITGTRPAARKYDKATGFACPDTAACNPAFSGFVSQVYFAARQFQRYADGLAGSYRAGRTQNILYNPSAACGSQPVYIANVATAGLYNYTPYVPNAAALAAGYGTGDSCSAYGNRNFFSYFTDWFGSTQSPGGEAILALYQNSGSAGGALGTAAGPIRCGLVGNGCVQTFQRGNIYWSDRTGAQVVLNGAISSSWAARSYEAGPLGYPSSPQVCGLTGGGCLQSFQNGTLYSLASLGTSAVMRGTIADRWASQMWEAGALGYPTGDPRCGLVGSGCLQNFQGGTIYATPATGAQVVGNGAIGSYWAARGWEASPLGYPTAAQFCGLAAGGCLQSFQAGTAYTTSAAGTWSVMTGPVGSAWAAQRWESGPLRYPTGDQTCSSSTDCVQPFQGGLLTVSQAFGARTVPLGPIADAWVARGAGGGVLGQPTRDQFCGLTAAGCGANFQGGSLYTTAATGTHAVLNGPIGTAWAAQRWENGRLGYPTGEQSCTSATDCTQAFQGGLLVTSSTTAAQVIPPGAVADAWLARGGAAGVLGAPTREQFCGLAGNGCVQNFRGGSLYTSPASGTHAVLDGPISARWASQGWEAGALGYPISEAQTTAGAVSQDFQGGRLVLDTATGQVRTTSTPAPTTASATAPAPATQPAPAATTGPSSPSSSSSSPGPTEDAGTTGPATPTDVP
ncbi:LGFP-repeat protein [Klenkia terrae]|uniref:LGFP repeat-containing protein n=1 Tax=Klenkia terrae TaxID=1052259 RepID=UPI0017579464|nr:hypothetical protein [Klenkia terrae]SSC24635.1 LGFP-repeat protein [Klenkia terrae]